MFITKNFHQCFSKIKCLPSSLSPPLTLEDEEEHVQESYPYNHHHRDHDHHMHDHHMPPLNIMVKNFNSIYETSLSSTTTTTTTTTEDSSTSDFSAAFASRRFFVSSPGQSKSIMDPGPTDNAARKLGVPIRKYSPDPYADFRRSMQEMVDARDRDQGDDWEYLQELLLCYLTLNPKDTHGFIIGAFADLLVSFMSSDHIDNCQIFNGLTTRCSYKEYI